MALFPLLNSASWGPSDLARRLLDDDLGGSPPDGEPPDPPLHHQRFHIQPSRQQASRCPARQQQQGTSAARTPDKPATNADTRNPTPEETSAKTEDNCAAIHGKHEEKSDDRGRHVKREPTRRHAPPEDVDPQSIKCHLNPNGHPALEAPRKNAPKKEEAKAIPIQVQHMPAVKDAGKK